MFLKEVEITYVSPCLADPEKIRLKATLSDDVTEMMPYLNAVIKNAIYNDAVKYITLFKDFRLITLYPREMTMIKAINTTDAWQVIDWLQDLLNRVYAQREEIEPNYQLKKRPHPLQLYTWLPRTNCRKCGWPTCLAFAVHLFSGQEDLNNCLPLWGEDYQEYKEVLVELASAFGYEEEFSL